MLGWDGSGGGNKLPTPNWDKVVLMFFNSMKSFLLPKDFFCLLIKDVCPVLDTCHRSSLKSFSEQLSLKTNIAFKQHIFQV